MSTTTVKTGRIRFRHFSRWWYSQGVLVLQVELHTTGYVHTEYDTCIDVDRLHWRDARAEDLAGGVRQP